MIDVAIDNSVISQFLSNRPKTETEKEDIASFDQMIDLAKNGIIALGGPVSTLMPENLMMAGESRERFFKKLKGVIKYWPVADSNQEDTNNRIKCLHKIMQDKGQDDTRQLVLIGKLSQARHFVTMDYKFYRQFGHRKNAIIKQCGINIFVMTPSEFMKEYTESLRDQASKDIKYI